MMTSRGVKRLEPVSFDFGGTNAKLTNFASLLPVVFDDVRLPVAPDNDVVECEELFILTR